MTHLTVAQWCSRRRSLQRRLAAMSTRLGNAVTDRLWGTRAVTAGAEHQLPRRRELGPCSMASFKSLSLWPAV